MATIESLVFDFKAHTAEWSKGIEKVHKDLTTVGQGFSSLKGLAVGALGAIGLAAGFGELKGMVTETINAVTANSRLASSLGITSAQLRGIQEAAKDTGLETEDINKAFGKFTKNIGEAVVRGGSANEMFTALGLSAKDLADQSLDSSFKQVAESISKIENPVQRSLALTELFGKEGAKLGPMFAGGAQGIEDAQKGVLATGQALNAVDDAKVVQAWTAMDNLGDVVEGIANQFVVTLAPVITYVAERITSLSPAAETFKTVFATALETIGDMVGGMMDLWEGLRQCVLLFAMTGIDNFAMLAKAMHVVIQADVYLMNLLGANVKVPEWITNFTVATTEFADAFHKNVVDEMNQEMPSVGWHHYLENIKDGINSVAQKMADKKNVIAAPFAEAFSEAHKRVTSTLEKMQDEIDNFGLSALEKELAEIGKAGSDKELAKATAMYDKIMALQQQQKGAALDKEYTSPVDKYREELGNLNKLLESNDIKTGTYLQARAKATKEFESKAFGDTSKRVSAEQRSFNFSIDTKAGGEPLTEMKDYTKQMLDLDREQRDRDIQNNDALKKLAETGSLQVATF